MHVARLGNRLANSPFAPAVVLGSIAICGALVQPPWHLLVLLVTTLIAVGWTTWLNADLRAIVSRVSGRRASQGQSPVEAVHVEIARYEKQVDALHHRTREHHPISGLPVREALADRIGEARSGILGVIALKDVDRLCAFDPALSDRFVARCAERLLAMLSGSRFLAQIDRGHFGIWFGEAVNAIEAQAELDAITYALGSAVLDNGTHIVPQTEARLAHYEGGALASPRPFIAQALASLALPQRDPAAATLPAAVEQQAARIRFTLEQDLRHAIDRRELHLVYQPLIDAERGCTDGAEALIRWQHPERGAIAPSTFIPILEEIGLADELGAWALNAAVREAQQWQASGLPPMRVAVNVSALQLQGDELPRFVERALLHHGGCADCLEIELTESVATSDAAHCRDVFAKLRAMGVKLAVDDFGTGYSGFSSLRRLAFDKIKIDREFVTDVHVRTDCQAICQSIIALGRGLGIRVLAEGVEEFAEYAWLRANGCRHFQGFYFSRPLAASDFIAFARDTAGLDARLAPSAELERLSA